jgi:hypothetical protein
VESKASSLSAFAALSALLALVALAAASPTIDESRVGGFLREEVFRRQVLETRDMRPDRREHDTSGEYPHKQHDHQACQPTPTVAISHA